MFLKRFHVTCNAPFPVALSRSIVYPPPDERLISQTLVWPLAPDVSFTVDFRNFIVFFWAETLAHWNPISCQKNIHNWFVRIWDSQIENSKIEIMETDRARCAIIENYDLPLAPDVSLKGCSVACRSCLITRQEGTSLQLSACEQASYSRKKRASWYLDAGVAPLLYYGY